MKLCLGHSEPSGVDATCLGALGEAHPPAPSRCVLPSSWQSALGPDCCWSSPPLSFLKEAVGWTQRAQVGGKGDRLPKQTGLSAGGGGNGRYRTFLPGCAGSCLWDKADLTCLALNAFLKFDLHQIAVLEHLVLPFWPLKSQGPFWYWHWEQESNSVTIHIPQSSEINTHKGVYLTY